MYTVEWLDSSLDELTAVWLAADPATRSAVRMAVSMADSRLQHDPQFQGESRDGNERVVFFDPLGFSVELDASRRIVTVLHVWRVRQKAMTRRLNRLLVLGVAVAILAAVSPGHLATWASRFK